MRELLYELTRGFAYRQIRHPEMRKYTTWLPLFVSAILAAAYTGLGLNFRWLGDGGVFANLQTLLSTLPGFYFAGLAAVATFGGAGMDNTMPEPTPSIRIRVRGKYIPHPLTRRQFLSYLFSYLVILSLILCLSLICINASAYIISDISTYFEKIKFGKYILTIAEFATGGIILFSFSSMIITTLHGIFFLTERMHQP